MVRITEDLVRKRSEHNEGQISTLEEISLHQQDITRIECLDKWCKHLKILYLQNNLIPKIENIGKMKKLEYLNLALNNVELIENLEKCESLEKLDLTVNFIGKLSSIDNLVNLEFLRELYLTGNPCADFFGYRDYVIATLPQLKTLDGTEIEKSERLAAIQNLSSITEKIHEQEVDFSLKRAIQRDEFLQDKKRSEAKKAKRERERASKNGKDSKHGYDGRWYTDVKTGKKYQQATVEEIVEVEDVPENDADVAKDATAVATDDEADEDEREDREFWEKTSEFTPESRMETHEHLTNKKDKESKTGRYADPPPPPRTLFNKNGDPLNVNEPKIDFSLTESEDLQELLLDIPVFKHLATELVDVDLQPRYAKVVIKKEIFQLVFPEEIKPGQSKATRSQITGHLLLRCPKLNPPKIKSKPIQPSSETSGGTEATSKSQSAWKLDDDAAFDSRSKEKASLESKLKSIYLEKGAGDARSKEQAREEKLPEGFVDDPDVPPLI